MGTLTQQRNLIRSKNTGWHSGHYLKVVKYCIRVRWSGDARGGKRVETVSETLVTTD